jgi:1,4-alpha-glucan branching enzyme
MHTDDVQRLIYADHHDPFSVLGPQSLGTNGKQHLVVRAFVPDAREVVVVDKDKSHVMEKVHDCGIFELAFPRRKTAFPYKLKITYPDDVTVTRHDAYSYGPVLTDYDLYLFSEGKNHRVYDKMGAHPMSIAGVQGTFFAVWAPNARRVSVVGSFNNWDGRVNQMRSRGSSGIWELFIPDVKKGDLYKFEIKAQNGDVLVKSDPYAFYSEMRPNTASVVHDDSYKWADKNWMEQRDRGPEFNKPVAIYEVHPGSWMRVPEDNNRWLNYRELADKLIPYVKDLGYTHIELLPVAEHPFDGSWGYQVTGYFAVTSRYGTPEDLKYFVDMCHRNDIGVIIDWVPGHFPKDAFGLAWFDGTCLYEHADPRQGEHADWGTLIFNYGRNEVRNFLLSNAIFWFDRYHIDGVRVDAVASMLYLDYSRQSGEWVPNRFGGRENLDAISFLKEMNEVIFSYYPGVLTIAEESTSWPGVSRPTYLGGLGFSYKWNMGWMNDILSVFSKDPVHRKYHHDLLTFAMLYAFHENFILVLSHDEVVHGKNSMLDKMPGDLWQKFANLRLLYTYMYGQPGKKLLFMGGEIGQWDEWKHHHSLDWHLLDYEPHRKLQSFVRELNILYKQYPAFYERDLDSSGFEWIDFHDTDNNIISFVRYAADRNDFLVFVFNFTPVPRYNYRIGVPRGAYYREILNSDAEVFGGSNLGNRGGVWSDEAPWQWRSHSVQLDVPPLGAVILKPE